MAAAIQDYQRSEQDRLNEVKGHLEIALLEKHFLRECCVFFFCVFVFDPFFPMAVFMNVLHRVKGGTERERGRMERSMFFSCVVEPDLTILVLLVASI